MTKYRHRNKISKIVSQAMSLLKEDTLTFGLLVEKAISKEEAFQYPIVTLSLSLGNTDGSLRSQQKQNYSSLPNCKGFLIV